MVTLVFVGIFPNGPDKGHFGYHASCKKGERSIEEMCNSLSHIYAEWDKEYHIHYTWEQYYEGEKWEESENGREKQKRLVRYGYQGSSSKTKC